ncbi:hypothetical protein EWB00_001516, partial [Schistosoma japonicum]
MQRQVALMWAGDGLGQGADAHLLCQPCMGFVRFLSSQITVVESQAAVSNAEAVLPAG